MTEQLSLSLVQLEGEKRQSYKNLFLVHGNNLSIVIVVYTITVFPGVSVVKTGNIGLIPGSGRSPGEGNDNPLQYPCLRNPKDRGAW